MISSDRYTSLIQYLKYGKLTEYPSMGIYGKIFSVNSLFISPTKINHFLEINVGDKFGKPIRDILIKVCLLNPIIKHKDKEYDRPYYYYRDEDGYDMSEKDPTVNFVDNVLQISPINRSEFNNEINIQTDIYLKTLHYGQPLCPAILCSFICPQTNHDELLQLLHIPNTPSTVNKKLTYGIIVMNYINGSHLKGYIIPLNVKEKTQLKYMAMFAIITLALETGYTHGDHHYGNIMFEADADDYFDKIHGRISLIDFGRTSKIPPKQLQEFISLCNIGKYVEALLLLCKKEIANEYVFDLENSNVYGWACGNYNGRLLTNEFEVETDNSIKYLFEQRELAIDKNIQKQNKAHNLHPSQYPLFPLSNSIKNTLYEGTI